MPQIGEVRRIARTNGEGTYKQIWQACGECGKERWIFKYDYDKGQRKICHHCYVMNHSIISKEGIHYEVRGANNPRWNGGRRITKDGYIMVWVSPTDKFSAMRPKSDVYVLEHRLIMARALDRILLSNEWVHHKDGNRQNNKIENLELTTNKAHQKGYRIGYENGWKDRVKYAQSL